MKMVLIIIELNNILSLPLKDNKLIEYKYPYYKEYFCNYFHETSLANKYKNQLNLIICKMCYIIIIIIAMIYIAYIIKSITNIIIRKKKSKLCRLNQIKLN